MSAYEAPSGFASSFIAAEHWPAFLGLLERRTSLPRLRAEVDLLELSEDALERFAAAVDELQIAEARENPAAFVEYALTNETTGDDLRNAEHHNEWHRFLDAEPMAVLFAPVEHAKTTHVAVGRSIWNLGKNPNRRLAIISNTGSQAEKILASVKLNITENPRVRRVFPELRPSEREGDPWHSKAITVARTTIAKDPSIQAIGVGGPLVGSRLDGAVLDDVLDFENTRTAEQMQKLLEWCDTTLLTRMVDGAFVHAIGTPWNKADLLHLLAERPGFKSRRFSAVRNPDDHPDAWVPLWPAQFSIQRLRDVYQNTTPSTFARKYLCRVTTNETSRFRSEWIDEAIRRGMRFGAFPLGPLRTEGGIVLRTFTGVDLAIGQNVDNDLTAIVTIALWGDQKIVLDIQSGRWQAPDILGKIRAVQQRYDSHVVVEDNGAQSFLVQWAADWQIPVTPFRTGRNKYSEAHGIESLAVEMRAGEWEFPNAGGVIHSELVALRYDLETYNPSSHTGDRLMALWFAREAARSASTGIARVMETMVR